jgi:hypothetical protein
MEGTVLAMARKKTARPLDDYRRERYMSVTEFIEFLGVGTHTYYAALAGRGTRPTTMRRIAEKLGVHPSEISEFAPQSSQQ